MKKILFSLVVIGLVMGFLFVKTPFSTASWFDKDSKEPAAEAPVPKENNLEDQPFTFSTFSKIAKQESPAVVNINTTKIMKNEFRRVPRNQRTPFDDLFGDDFFYHFFGPDMPNQKVQSLGSGVIIDDTGYILTNNHVIEGFDEIKVKTLDGKSYDAKVIGADPQTDIALIKIESEDRLVAIEVGDSDLLEVGDWVMAIGNPFGFGHTVTVGVVSAKGRSLVMPTTELPYQDFIQTDASINPGNSGGPLIDIHGRLVGINSVIASRTGQSAGIGFAIAINMIKTLIPDLKEKGSVTRGWLGVSIQTLDEGLSESMNLKSTNGALVAEVVVDSPADKAGIKVGDIITEYDGVEVKDSSHLSRMVASTNVDKEVKIVLLRGDETLKKTINIGKREPGLDSPKAVSETANNLGMTVQDITPELARQMNLDVTEGVLISNVESEGPASDAGLQRGDIVIEINRKKVKSVAEYQKIITALKPGEVAVFYIQRDDARIFVAVKTTKTK